MSDEERFYEEDPLDADRSPGGEKKLPELDIDEDASNLVTELLDRKGSGGLEALREIARSMVEDFDEAWEGSADYRARRAADLKILLCDLPPKDFPFEDAANVHVPQMLEAIMRLVSRYKGEIFGDRTSVFNVIPLGPDDKERAEILTKHGNWQLREDIPDFYSQMSKAILEWFLSGDVTVHSHYDAFRKQNRHESLSCEEFVTPYMTGAPMPDYSNCPYYVRIHNMKAHELQAMEGWEGVDAVIKRTRPSWDDEPETPLSDSVAEVEGIDKPEGTESGGSYKILQYEGWKMLPGQTRPRWVQGYIHHATGNLMQLSIHEEPSWKERARYKAQIEERDRYFSDKGLYESEAQKRAAAQEFLMQPGADPMAMQEAQMTLQQPELPPPMMPAWMADADGDNANALPPPMEMTPIYMFTHGQFLVPPAGNLGIGPGRQQADLNRMSNTAASQFSDSATLANCSVIVTSGLVDFERPFEWTPGGVNKVQGVTGGELRNHIIQLDAKPANPQLLDLVRLSMEQSQSSIQSPDVLSGAAGKSGETFRGIATRVEQATKTLSVSAQDFAYEVLRPVLRCNGRLNAIHLPTDEIQHIFNHRLKESEEVRFGRGLYQQGYEVMVTADMRFNSQAQKVAEAQELVALGQQDDILKQNVAFRTRALQMYLEARDLHELVPLLQQGPPQPMQQPPQPMQGGQASQPKGANGAAGPAPEGPQA